MSLKEKIKSAARIVTIPKDWKAKGNMEFDELLSISFSYPEVAEKEIYERFKYWYREFRIVQTVMLVIIALSSTAIAITCNETHNVTTICIIAILLTSIMAGVLLMKRRAKVIHGNLIHCYSWLLNEIIHHDADWCNVPPSLEKAFIKASAQAERREYVQQKKFKRIIKGFGYSLTTLNN